MSEMHVLTFLTSAERALVMALLEEQLNKLVETLRQGKNPEDLSSTRDQMKVVVTLLDKLHRASALDKPVAAPPERKSST